jgi:hypothetical protein
MQLIVCASNLQVWSQWITWPNSLFEKIFPVRYTGFMNIFIDEIKVEDTHEWLEENANDEIKVYRSQWTPHTNSMAPHGYPYSK